MFKQARKTEESYARRLRSLARAVGSIVSGIAPDGLSSAVEAAAALRRYADGLAPWARSVAESMVSEVAARDERSWFRAASHMRRALKDEIRTAPTGAVMQARMREQVRLITSLPVDAAEHVHARALEGISEGWRADRIAAEILRTGDVTKSRADLIARTEVGRTSTLLTQARAEHVGSTHYVWRTSEDEDVRRSHRALAGKVIAWSEPPTTDGLVGHAGTLPNCRCYCEPVIPD